MGLVAVRERVGEAEQKGYDSGAVIGGATCGVACVAVSEKLSGLWKTTLCGTVCGVKLYDGS